MPPLSTVPQLRGAKVIAVILSAALEEISEKGYAGLSIESVAERAGVNKTTVYRRWPTKAELTLAALAQQEEVLFADPDTGDIVQDFLIVARRLSSILRTKRGRALYLVVLQDAIAGGELRAPGADRRDARAIVERGIARGELPPGTDPELVMGTLFGAVIQHALFEHGDLTADYLRRLVAFVMAGIASTKAHIAPRARRRSGARRRAS